MYIVPLIEVEMHFTVVFVQYNKTIWSLRLVSVSSVKPGWAGVVWFESPTNSTDQGAIRKFTVSPFVNILARYEKKERLEKNRHIIIAQSWNHYVLITGKQNLRNTCMHFLLGLQL